MTVDSRYAIAQYNEDGEVVYRFFTESIGDEAMQVWKVAGDGTRTQLTAVTDYTIAYDLSQTPTFIGGTITLTTPLEDGFKLSVERKTPIVNDLTLESLTPFPSERFEYMMDKICFIQQEIEGSFCDCRSTDIQPPIIEQQPTQESAYQCDSLTNFWNTEQPNHLWRYLQGGPTPSAGVNDTIIADFGGLDLTIDPSDYSENNPEGSPMMDNCEGYNWNNDVPGQIHEQDVGNNPLGVQDFEAEGYTTGFVRDGSISQGIVNGLTFREQSIGGNPSNPARGTQVDGNDVKSVNSGTKTWNAVIPDTGTYSVIVVYRRDMTVPPTVYDPSSTSEVECFVDGVSQGTQFVQTFPVCTGLREYLRVFGDNNSSFQDHFVIGRPWTQTDVDRHQLAYEGNFISKAPVTFTVVASGIGTLTYQWWQDNAGDLNFTEMVGETSTSITVPVTSTNNYYVIVTDGLGQSVQSDTVSVV